MFHPLNNLCDVEVVGDLEAPAAGLLTAGGLIGFGLGSLPLRPQHLGLPLRLGLLLELQLVLGHVMLALAHGPPPSGFRRHLSLTFLTF